MDEKDEVKTEETETEETKETETEETKVETETPLPKLVETIREEYETKIAEMEAKHASEIADRDAIIQQLISGGTTGDNAREKFVDKINEKRTYKKW